MQSANNRKPGDNSRLAFGFKPPTVNNNTFNIAATQNLPSQATTGAPGATGN